jgi:dienelactone hydrolase
LIIFPFCKNMWFSHLFLPILLKSPKNIMNRSILWLSLFFLVPYHLFAQSGIWKNLDKGNYKVGFRVFLYYDSTRTIKNPKGYRPVQISYWYPAQVYGFKKLMTYKDYFLLSAEETSNAVSEAYKGSAFNNYQELLSQNGISKKAIDYWFNSKMLAYRDANELKGKFPLVIVAQGNFHSAHHQAFLCEFIASNGFIVVTTPSQTRITGQMTDNSQAIESANNQVRDMEFAISSLKNYKNIDFNDIALIGHSFGGRSILLLQMKDKNVKCLISLDGGLGLNTAVDDIKKSGVYDPSKMNVPLLHFYEDTESFIKPDFSLINNFSNSARFLIKINDMHHFYFSSFGLVSGTIKGFHPLSKNLAEKYKMICDFTRDYLKAVFKEDNSGMKKIKKEFSSFAERHSFLSFEFK